MDVKDQDKQGQTGPCNCWQNAQDKASIAQDGFMGLQKAGLESY